MLRVGNQIKVCGVVIGDAKGFFKFETGVDGKPNMGNCGVDEGENALARKKVFGAFLVGELDGLEADDKITRDVGGEIEWYVIGGEARLVIAAEGKGCIDLF